LARTALTAAGALPDDVGDGAPLDAPWRQA
jgi:hypothetical protein